MKLLQAGFKTSECLQSSITNQAATYTHTKASYALHCMSASPPLPRYYLHLCLLAMPSLIPYGAYILRVSIFANFAPFVKLFQWNFFDSAQQMYNHVNIVNLHVARCPASATLLFFDVSSCGASCRAFSKDILQNANDLACMMWQSCIID